MRLKRIIALIIITAAAAFVPAFALTLQEAKEQGLVGETERGYLGAVSSTAEVQALVRSINDQRRVLYQQIAGKNNTPVQAVEALAGKKAIDKTPPGQYIEIGGSWRRK